MSQLSINFNVVHARENNAESQSTLELKRERFNKQCWNVLMRLLAGEKITNKTGLDTGIGDIRRRAKDLIDGYGIPIKREWALIDGKKQEYKWYYIDEVDRKQVAEKIIYSTNIN